MNNQKLDNAIDSAIVFEQRIVRNMVKIELDRVWELYSQRRLDWEAKIGTSLEKLFFDDAVAFHQQYETTKTAYRAIGLTGNIGIHKI
jgi:hypothetical protein